MIYWTFHTAVYNILMTLKEHGTIGNKGRSGRPRLMADRAYRKQERVSLGDKTAKFNENAKRQMCKRTVQSHSLNNGFHSRIFKNKVFVTVGNKKKRL